MDIAYEPRKPSDRNVQEMLRDAELNLAEDTTEEERLTALCNLKTAIECGKYKV
jgi:anti-sigma28 factor (negative regulator of flagellin synthesis)